MPGEGSMTSKIYLTQKIQSATTFLTDSINSKTGLVQTTLIWNARNQLFLTNPYPPEKFTTLLALDILDDQIGLNLTTKLREAVGLRLPTREHPTVHFFIDNDTYNLPCDLDTTSLFYLTHFFQIPLEQLATVRQLILDNYCPKQGLFKTYFPPMKTHDTSCTVVNLNSLRLLYKLEVKCDIVTAVENNLYSYLTSNEYLQGTRYYASPDAFLFTFAKTIGVNLEVRSKFIPGLVAALVSRMGKTSFPLDAAQRILAASYVGVLEEFKVNWGHLLNLDVSNLIKKQQDDGGWEPDSMFMVGRSKIYLGGRETTTIFALAALAAYRKSYRN